jgi:hypothetical protein
LREWEEGFAGAQADYVEDVEAAVAEEGADLAEERLARGAAEFADAWDGEAEHGERGVDLEGLAQLGGERGGEVDHGGEAHVWLVDAVACDGLVVGHLHEGLAAEVDAGGVERCAQKAFGCGEDGGHLREADLEVDLGEVGLTVGAEVFVAEAAGDLEVAVEAGDHEELLEDLRRLRKSEEVAGVDARRHKVVTRAFRRGAGE